MQRIPDSQNQWKVGDAVLENNEKIRSKVALGGLEKS